MIQDVSKAMLEASVVGENNLVFIPAKQAIAIAEELVQKEHNRCAKILADLIGDCNLYVEAPARAQGALKRMGY